MLSPVLCGSTRAVIEVPDSSEPSPTMKNAASVEVRHHAIIIPPIKRYVLGIKCQYICLKHPIYALQHCMEKGFIVRIISTFSFANWPTASIYTTPLKPRNQLCCYRPPSWQVHIGRGVYRLSTNHHSYKDSVYLFKEGGRGTEVLII